jgi:nicotinamide mononucleotide (NMN) deamidase PncC
MSPIAQQKLIERIHASGTQLVLSLTGGGSGAIAALLQVPGASVSVLEAIVPYSATAMQDWLGGPVDQYCSEKTARAMAMRAFERARELSDVDPHTLIGIGVTASLASNRPKRGAHRIHVAWQSATVTAVATFNFTTGASTRDEEEDVSTQIILRAVAEACGIPVSPSIETSIGMEVERHEKQAEESWTELLLGSRTSIAKRANGVESQPTILFPGAFNPPHWGHEQMARIAARRCGGPVTFELSITNVDKPPLDFLEIAGRLEQLAGRPILLTRAATFVEKARLAPGCAFVVGVDTIERIADPVYYECDVSLRDAAIAEIAARGCRFLVFGRRLEGRFAPLSAVKIPASLRTLCEEVPEAEFNADVSSTALRQTESE